MNFNYSPFMNFNNISNLNFNNPNINFNPNQISQNMLQMNNPFNMGLPNNNFMNESFQEEKQNNSNYEKSENIYPYIKGERKEIIFINSTNEIKIVKIPISLRKNEIYSIAESYKSSYYYEIKQLIHNNKILENDDSSIDCILNGDSIKIIEFLDDCDLSYYDSLLLKHKNSLSPKYINIIFTLLDGVKYPLIFPKDITGIEIKKSFCSRNKVPFKYIKDLQFLYNAAEMNDNEILKNIIPLDIRTINVIVREKKDILPHYPYIKGKKIKVSIYSKNPKKILRTFDVGTLNQIKELYEFIELYFNAKGKGIIYPGGIELTENDERAFSEIGIRDNFTCKWINIKKLH